MIYIVYENYWEIGKGVQKKIKAQCQVFQEAFKKVYYTVYSGQMLHLFQNDKLIEKEFALTEKECNEIIVEWLIKYNIRRTYIRYWFADKWLIYLLQKQKELGIKSVLEFPSIPYDGIFSKQIVSEDHYYREQIHEFIHCCTTFGKYHEVFQIPCIAIPNGVDIKEQKKKHLRKPDGTIVLLAVARFWKAHGYERLIEGIHNYYNNGGDRNIIFNIVGDGVQLEFYRRLVDAYHLHKHVIFYGRLEGEALDLIYDNSDIAVSALGFYKVGIQSAAPIKSGEYCSRGIPFIYGYDELSVDENIYFVCKVTNDATPININSVIDFYEKMYNGKDFIEDMRVYAKEHLLWKKILRPVIEYLN